MDFRLLRQKYPVFSFDKYEYSFKNESLKINYFFTANELEFTHQIIIPGNYNLDESAEQLIFNLGLSILPSYWKLTCSPTINLPKYLTPDQINFWHKLFIKGMGEYYYKNQIDFTPKDFLKIISDGSRQTSAQGEPSRLSGMVAEHSQLPDPSNKILVPIGGGKDSIVTLEILKTHYIVTAFAVNPVPLIKNVINKSGLPTIFVESIFDPQLFELNQIGYLNGHVPISAFYAFASLLVAYLQNISYVAISNERSTSEGNTVYLGQEINHQYSKTLEFETDLNNLISQSLNHSVTYFSFLRPLYELQITKIFSHYSQYFDIFSSCNNNFKLQTHNSSPITKWCQSCPKCVSTALMLTCFISKEKVAGIMGSFPPDLPSNLVTINQLTGLTPVKPFECVLTRAEAVAALNGTGLDQILNSWQDNPNMPVEFAKILKSSL